jgi:hypothetical protein
MFSIFSKRSKTRSQPARLSDAETELIAHAVSLFRNPDLGHQEIFQKLVGAGVPRRNAARLVEFLPSAYCRVIFPEMHYSESFQRRLPDGSMSPERLLSTEPMWNLALAFARDEMARGTPAQELLTVASQSAEFATMTHLCKGGSQPRHIHLTPTALLWPEDGPED